MEPQRKVTPGPTAPSNRKTQRKSFAITSTFLRAAQDPGKEVITVHASTPNVEKRSFHVEQSQVYNGDVNVLSIM